MYARTTQMLWIHNINANLFCLFIKAHGYPCPLLYVQQLPPPLYLLQYITLPSVHKTPQNTIPQIPHRFFFQILFQQGVVLVGLTSPSGCGSQISNTSDSLVVALRSSLLVAPNPTSELADLPCTVPFLNMFFYVGRWQWAILRPLWINCPWKNNT